MLIRPGFNQHNPVFTNHRYPMIEPRIYQTLIQHIKDIAEQEIIHRFERTTINFKQDGSIVTETDLAVQNRLQTVLAELTPEIPLLGEEMTAEEQHKLANENPDGLWCLDPLDGTTNYANGFPFFAVSLALLKNNQSVFGVVYDPMRKECFWAIEGQGAWLNQTRLLCPSDEQRNLKQSIAVVDFKRLPDVLSHYLVKEQPFASQRSLGSVALDWCWLAANRYHVYLHGRQKSRGLCRRSIDSA